MEQFSARILERSSDAIVVIRLGDRTILGVNEAFFAVTGRPQHELVGRDIHDLLVPLEWTHGPKAMDALGELAALADVPIGLWTRAEELRHGYLSALVLDEGGQREAVCVVRDVRDPTPRERRLAARERFMHTIETGGPRLEVATRAIRALGESLRWEFGALWLRTPETASLRCAAVWRSRFADLQPLEAASWRTTAVSGVGLVGRCWRDRQAAWTPDALKAPDPEPRQQTENMGELVRGWFGFPVWSGSEAIGVVELFSREVRQPDEELLQMTAELGRLLGRFLADERSLEPSDTTAGSDADADAEQAEGAVESVSSALRNLGQAAVTVAGAMERQPDVRSTRGSPEMLRELAVRIGRLDRLLEGAFEPSPEARQDQRPSAVVGRSSSAGPEPTVPTGLTLKAVSRRTGVPAATLRTWERRYGFLRPARSASGYRLYGEQEIEQVQAVKRLLEQGVRIGAAMEAVRGTSIRPQAAG